MVADDETGGGNAAVELGRLRREIAEIRRARLDAQRATSTRQAVEHALEAAAQDRDAVSSPELEELRRRGQELSGRLDGAWQNIDCIRVMLARVSAAGFDGQTGPVLPGRNELLALLEEEVRLRRRMREDLAGLGVVSLRVPDPPPLTIRQHARREVLVEALENAVEEAASREARQRTPTRHRPPDQPGAIRGPR